MEQEVFNFNFKKNYKSEDFFVSKSNEFAYKLLLNKISLEKFIFLKGPNKSGKTHLGLLWKKMNKATIYNNNYNFIIQNKKNIFFDDLKLNLDEENLFHIINHCNHNNLKILITSKFYPSEYHFQIKDLSSRIKSFNLVEIKEPDDELLNNLLLKLLYDKQIIIKNNEIFFYITKRINRTYLDIYNFVEKIDRLSLSKKKQLTIPLIK